MSRYLPHITIIVLCALAWMTLDYLPFQDNPVLNEGYARHFLFGTGLMAAAMLIAYWRQEVPFAAKRYIVWASFLTAVLLVVELLQHYDPGRHVQWEDVVAQTLGIVISAWVLMFFEHKQSHAA